LEDEASYSLTVKETRKRTETITWCSIKLWCTQSCGKHWSLQKCDFTTRKYAGKEGQIGEKWETISAVEESEDICFPQLGKEITEDIIEV